MVGLAIARGDLPQVVSRPIRSALPGVTDEAWTKFVRVLATKDASSVSDSNGLGCFEMRPRRLVDLGLMSDLKATKKGQRQTWDGTFVLPLTRDRFLGNPIAQYNAFVLSMKRYDRELALSSSMSRSGALAILHRAGPSGLKSFGKQKFSDTVALYERARDLF